MLVTPSACVLVSPVALLRRRLGEERLELELLWFCVRHG